MCCLGQCTLEQSNAWYRCACPWLPDEMLQYTATVLEKGFCPGTQSSASLSRLRKSFLFSCNLLTRQGKSKRSHRESNVSCKPWGACLMITRKADGSIFGDSSRGAQSVGTGDRGIIRFPCRMIVRCGGTRRPRKETLKLVFRMMMIALFWLFVWFVFASLNAEHQTNFQ